MTESTVRVRFAPSPTGALHIGGARTAYFNWLFAKQQGGTMVLRIDDTDSARSTQASYQQIIDSLNWLGITWNEGPVVGGSYGPYRQSERKAIYEQEINRLIAQGKVYPCFCSVEQLQEDRDTAQREGRPQKYVGRCKHLSDDERKVRLKNGEQRVYRLHAPEKENMVFQDVLHGEVVVSSQEIDDFIVWKADGTPTYHFASCVDDALMKISHIIRAEEHLSNTPRHIALFDALGYSLPIFAHIPMILAPDRSKLSKRHGATSVEEYRQAGILPDALINYFLLLGFAPQKENDIISRQEAIEVFDLQRVTKHAAMYDIKKLEWMNAQYFRQIPVDIVLHNILSSLVSRGWITDDPSPQQLAWLRTIVAFVKERARNEQELMTMMSYYFEGISTYDRKGVTKYFASKEVVQRLRFAIEILIKVTPFTSVTIEEAYRQLITELGIKGGDLIHPTRLAISGVTVGPGLFDIMALLGRGQCIQRIEHAISAIDNGILFVE